MSEERLLPPPFSISATPERGSNPRLFRPKELREVVFPEIGMVMYPLFWVKYSLYLDRKSFDLSSQNNLFLWAEKENETYPEESLLYYSLLSEYYSKEEDKNSIAVGSRAAKGWLFKQDFYERIINGLERYCRNPTDFNYQSFIDEVFHSDFKTDCSRSNVKLDGIVKSELERADVESEDDYKDQMKLAVEHFVESVAKAFSQTGKSGKNVIGPNINFVQKILLTEESQPKNLVNVSFDFTREEAVELLNSLQSTEKGRYLLKSIVLVSYFDPTSHEDKYMRKKMRKISEVYSKTSNFMDRVRSKFSEFEFNPLITERLEQTAFYWELNFFLADGEDIARNFLHDRKKVTKKKLKEHLRNSDRRSVRYIDSFIEKLDQKRWKNYLSKLIRQFEGKDEDLEQYFSKLLTDLERKTDLVEIFLDLLEEQGTIERSSENLFRVVGSYSEESSTASFYGINQMIGWTRTILRGMDNE
ncbi:hypothetical protein AKJ64_00330 [candidate division MSBL1 archaeon SCGC-AAA259E17]|uniref:Uncharacterized protein n=1 Tax=candidate division MSBL1 archaeon SCGC-AAA259E17 TaxID=1698263 RepID=A0A133UHH4_9EURY|nr:hypothetical protein AKJ64_00330 [candidate division MSBL1 archaeon SCGC-AAA259E17]